MRPRHLFVLVAITATLTGCSAAGLDRLVTPKPDTSNTVTVAAEAVSPAYPPYCHDGACHPRDTQGFVTDGSAQADDGHCVGTTRQQVACLTARRPQCIGWSVAMSRSTAMGCWAAQINVYPWPHDPMFGVLMCESGGDTGASNQRHWELFQSSDYTSNPTDAFEDAYYSKWNTQHQAAWSQTWGRTCGSP